MAKIYKEINQNGKIIDKTQLSFWDVWFDNENFQKKYEDFEKKYMRIWKKINLVFFAIGISDIIVNSVKLIDASISESNIVFGLVLFLLFAFEIVCIFELNSYSYIAEGVVI